MEAVRNVKTGLNSFEESLIHVRELRLYSTYDEESLRGKKWWLESNGQAGCHMPNALEVKPPDVPLVSKLL